MNKLFTHTDLDGVGCAIIAKLVYGDEIDISYCSYNDIDKKVGLCNPDKYNHVDITDISIKESLAELIDKDHPTQVSLFDHHATAKYLDKYSWVTIEEKDECTGLLTCGTEIYFKHIGNYIEGIQRAALESFVRNVTNYDTWKWKDLGEEGVISKKINDLLYIYGKEKFVNWAIDRLKTGSFPNFTKADEAILEARQNEIEQYIEKKDLQSYEYTDFDGRKFGVVFAENYLSELGNALCERHPEWNYVAIIDMGNKSVSYRTVRDDIDLGKDIASLCNGGGHAKAAGSRFDNLVIVGTIDAVFGGLL